MTIKEFSIKVDGVLANIPEEYNGLNRPEEKKAIDELQKKLIEKFAKELHK